MAESTEVAILAGGCFWPMQELLRGRKGVIWDTIADADACRMFPGKVVTKISQAGPFWAAKAEDQDYLRDFPDKKNQFGR